MSLKTKKSFFNCKKIYIKNIRKKRKQQNLVFKNLNWQKIRQQELSDDIINIDKIRRQCK